MKSNPISPFFTPIARSWDDAMEPIAQSVTDKTIQISHEVEHQARTFTREVNAYLSDPEEAPTPKLPYYVHTGLQNPIQNLVENGATVRMHLLKKWMA